MRRVFVPLLLALATAPASAQTCFGDDADCDADGYSVNQGDCDDSNADVKPGLPETCGDEADNDCNGLFDDGDACARGAQLGRAQGGGGCTGGSGVAGTALIVLPVLFRRRRRAQ